MLVPFKLLNNDSKIWIYQSSRKFSEPEKNLIVKKTSDFLTEWTAHGHSLQAGFEIVFDQFLIIGVNEDVNEASGCSIDKSVNHIRNLEKSLNVKLLERSKIALKENTKISLVNFSEIKKMISQGLISKETQVFNNAVTSKGELGTSWIQTAGHSWMKRYF